MKKLLIALLLCSNRLSASDLSVTIPEATLTQYASAVGPVTGTGEANITILVPYFQVIPDCFATTKRACFHLTWRLQTLCSSTYNWTILNPSFKVDSTGISLRATLFATSGTNSFSQQVVIPATVAFDQTSSQIRITLVSAPVAINLNVFGATRTVATVDIAPYFATALYIGQGQFSVGGHTIAGRADNVTVQLQPGNLIVSGDASFQ
jgi:hypothetical protein